MIRCCGVDLVAFGHHPDCPLGGALRRATGPQDALEIVVHPITLVEAAKAVSDRYSARKARTWADRRARSAAARKDTR